MALLYSCLYWRKYCQDEPHERIRYVSHRLMEEIHRRHPVCLPDGVFPRSQIRKEAVPRGWSADCTGEREGGQLPLPFALDTRHIDLCGVGVVRQEKAYFLQLLAEGGMLRSCQTLPLLRDPLLGFPLSELLDEIHMVTRACAPGTGGCHAWRNVGDSGARKVDASDSEEVEDRERAPWVRRPPSCSLLAVGTGSWKLGARIRASRARNRFRVGSGPQVHGTWKGPALQCRRRQNQRHAPAKNGGTNTAFRYLICKKHCSILLEDGDKTINTYLRHLGMSMPAKK